MSELKEVATRLARGQTAKGDDAITIIDAMREENQRILLTIYIVSEFIALGYWSSARIVLNQLAESLEAD